MYLYVFIKLPVALCFIGPSSNGSKSRAHWYFRIFPWPDVGWFSRNWLSGSKSTWVHYNDLTVLPNPGIIVNKGNHPQMAELFRLVKYYNLPRCMLVKKCINSSNHWHCQGHIPVGFPGTALPLVSIMKQCCFSTFKFVSHAIIFVYIYFLCL